MCLVPQKKIMHILGSEAASTFTKNTTFDAHGLTSGKIIHLKD